MQRSSTSAARTVLVCSGAELLGDGLMKLPFLRALRQAWPDARITWLAGTGPSVFGGVLADLVRPYLDEVIEDAEIGARWREILARPLPGRRFDLVIDTQRRFRTTAILRRISHETFVSGAARWTLSDHRPRLFGAPERHMVRAMLQLIAVAGGGRSGIDCALHLPEQLVRLACAVLPGTGHVGFAPGAGDRRKCWPLDRFIAVAQDMAAEGWRPVFLLGPAERDMVAAIREGCPEALLPLQHDAGEKACESPLFTVACARRLQGAVANDSGIGHLLAAADIPLLSLFGPTPPAKFAPIVSRGSVLRAQRFGGPGMGAIPAAAVGEELRRLLA